MSNIYLIGPPLSGKTTIGKYLAKELEYNFFDTDEILKQTISLDLVLRNEKKFRKLETKIYQKNYKEPFVISTGGGVVLDLENFKIFNGIIIYLKVDCKVLEYRNKLAKHNMYKNGVKYLLDKRKGLYEKYANIIYKINPKLEIYPLVLDLISVVKDYEKENINN